MTMMRALPRQGDSYLQGTITLAWARMQSLLASEMIMMRMMMMIMMMVRMVVMIMWIVMIMA